MTSSSDEINSYDLDGVITIGIKPREEDIIITGRSFEEAPETYHYLHQRDIYNAVFFQTCRFDDKSRQASGKHKAKVLKSLIESGVAIAKHFEDDPIQAQEISNLVDVPIVLLEHNMTEKENIRHFCE